MDEIKTYCAGDEKALSHMRVNKKLHPQERKSVNESSASVNIFESTERRRMIEGGRKTNNTLQQTSQCIFRGDVRLHPACLLSLIR
jgi:hypothetical protein